MDNLYYASQYFTTTLSVVGGIDASQTTDIVLQSVTGIDDTTKPGIALINYSNPLNESIAEWVTFTSINSTTKELHGVTRGAEKGSAKTHSNGVTVAFPISESHINNIADRLTGVDTTLASDTNGNELIKTSTTASAVNEITITNAATGNAPEISATGGDTNIDLKLKGKGTGTIEIYNPTSTAYETAVGETGWIPSTYTWTYASATTFTISSVDLTSVFTKGTKLKLTQTTDKYFYVVSSAFSTNTTVTVTGGTDYTLADAAITSPYFSYVDNPRGFPNVFTAGGTLTAESGSFTSYTCISKFRIAGGWVTINFAISVTDIGSAGGAACSITLPVNAVNTNFYTGNGINSSVATGVICYITSAGSLNFRSYNNSFPFGGNHTVLLQVSYAI